MMASCNKTTKPYCGPSVRKKPSHPYEDQGQTALATHFRQPPAAPAEKLAHNLLQKQCRPGFNTGCAARPGFLRRLEMKPSLSSEQYAHSRRHPCRTHQREPECAAYVLPSLLRCYVPGVKVMPEARLAHRLVKHLDVFSVLGQFFGRRP